MNDIGIRAHLGQNKYFEENALFDLANEAPRRKRRGIWVTTSCRLQSEIRYAPRGGELDP